MSPKPPKGGKASQSLQGVVEWNPEEAKWSFTLLTSDKGETEPCPPCPHREAGA